MTAPTAPLLDSPALTYRLAQAQERAEFADDDAAPGAPIKWSACTCTDDAHGFPDRSGWMASQESAYADVRRVENTGHDAHLVIRETRVVTGARTCRCQMHQDAS